VTHRENFFALVKGEDYNIVPIWLMGFENEDIARKLNSEYDFPENLSHNPERTNYPWNRISDDERERTLNYNHALLKPVVVVGWGANMPLGYSGPGEFHFSLIDLKENERTLICETGCKRLVKKNPYFYMDFDYPMKTVADLDKLILPNPHDLLRYKGFEDDVKFFKDAGFFTGQILTVFSADLIIFA